MISNPTFSQGTSYIHRLDPRIRLLMLLSFSLWCIANAHLTALTLGLLLSLVGVQLAALSWRAVWRHLLPVNLFVVLLLLLLPFSVSGGEQWQVGMLTFYSEGFWRAVVMGMQANAVMLALIVLVATLELSTLGQALHSLRVPSKLIHLLLLTVRYLNVLHDTWQQLTTAMRVRGFQLKANWHTYHSIGNLIGMLLVRAMMRARRIELAMKCRGYRGELYCLAEFQLSYRDAFAFCGFASVLCVISFILT